MPGDFESDAAVRGAVAKVLRTLLDQVDERDSEDHDPQISDGNLKTVFESGGTYVLSQQTPLHEIWLSAEMRAWHFQQKAGQWVERDSGEKMIDVLRQLFSDKLGMNIRFEL